MQTRTTDTEVTALRRARLNELAAGYPSVAEFCRTFGLDPGYIWQLMKGHGSFGEKSARNLQQRCNLPEGYFERQERQEGHLPEAWQRPGPGSFAVPVLDVHGSMGGGAFTQEAAGVLRQVTIDLTALKRMTSYTAATNLHWITGDGDSMEPTFKDGDPLLVDSGVNEHNADAVYALTLNGRLYVKTLQRRPDNKIVMISDNRKYEPYTIDEADDCTIHGRILVAWNARKL